MNALRRVTALLTAFALMQLSLLGVLLPCAMAPAGQVVTAETAAAHGSHRAPGPGESHHATGGHAERDRTETHPTPHGAVDCPSALACTAIELRGTALFAAADGTPRDRGVLILDALRPESVIGSPEPPPPRG